MTFTIHLANTSHLSPESACWPALHIWPAQDGTPSKWLPAHQHSVGRFSWFYQPHKVALTPRWSALPTSSHTAHRIRPHSQPVRDQPPKPVRFRWVQLLSRVQLFATWCAAVCQDFLPQSLLQLMFIELVMSSNHHIFCCPLFLLPSIFPSIRVFSNGSALHIRLPKYYSFSFSISSSNEYSGLIFFRIDWFDLLCLISMLRAPKLNDHQW